MTNTATLTKYGTCEVCETRPAITRVDIELEQGNKIPRSLTVCGFCGPKLFPEMLWLLP